MREGASSCTQLMLVGSFLNCKVIYDGERVRSTVTSGSRENRSKPQPNFSNDRRPSSEESAGEKGDSTSAAPKTKLRRN